MITNVMSPIVSYQYPNDFSSQALINGGISSPIVSYQYFEWPGDDVLELLSSPRVSYFYQIGSEPLPLVLHGRVTDTVGVGISGAAISATVGLTPAAQTTTDASGNYALPSLGAGVYALAASAPGHAKSGRALTLSAATANQDFQLTPLSAAPTTQQTSREPPTAFTQPPVGPLGSTLLVFDVDGSAFVPITADNAPQPDRMTIVMTHGWNSNPGKWAAGMAAQMHAQGVTPAIANIVAWDWRYDAAGPYPPEGRTLDEGKALGTALQAEAVLGPGYAQPIHFIGHSLGTLVNAAAANYLHGDRTAHEDVSPTQWRNLPMHMTLLDEAEAAFVFSGVEWFFDSLTLALVDAGVPLARPPSSTSRGYKSPIPIHASWIDNYVSLYGYWHSEAVNAVLNNARLYTANLHSYPMQWYGMSITNPSDANNPFGFQKSFEYAKLIGAPASFPPSATGFPLGVNYGQVSLSDQLALEQTFSLAQSFGIAASAVVQGSASAVQVVGNVVVGIEQSAQRAGAMIGQGFDYVGNVAAQGGQALLNLFDSAVMRLTLTTGPASSSPEFGPLAKSLQDIGGVTNTRAMAWLPIQFPANANAMAFDFTVAGDPVDDVLVCGIGTNNLFSLEAKYVPTNTISASRLIDVSAWAGTTNELFFGFMGGTSTNATLQIENIRFYSVATPRLEIARNGSATLLSWPSTAGGYFVETTPTLTSPTWEAMTNPPAISADRYVLTNSWSEPSRFLRLRAR